MPSADKHEEDVKYIAPSKKLDLQWRPKKMFKTRKNTRKRPNALKSPSWEERETIRSELVEDIPSDKKSNFNSQTKMKLKRPSSEKHETRTTALASSARLEKNSKKIKKVKCTPLSTTTSITDARQVALSTSTSLTEKLLQNDCFQLCLLDIISLELDVTQEELKKYKSLFSSFAIGWLHDEIINSFILDLARHHKHIIQVGSSEALLISHNKSFRKLWKDIDLTQKKLVVIPFNPNDIHWVLIIIDIGNKKVILLDPTNSKINKDDDLCERAFNVGKRILSLKFHSEVDGNLTTVDHVRQRDSKSCGVFVCYYAEQYAKGRFRFVYQSYPTKAD